MDFKKLSRVVDSTHNYVSLDDLLVYKKARWTEGVRECIITIDGVPYSCNYEYDPEVTDLCWGVENMTTGETLLEGESRVDWSGDPEGDLYWALDDYLRGKFGGDYMNHLGRGKYNPRTCIDRFAPVKN